MKSLKVIKIGGNIIDDQDALATFIKNFSALKGPKILIHGGGKVASQLAERLHIKVTMVEGRRITDAATLDIITMVYAGKINKNIVAKLQSHSCNAIGFSGADGNTIEAVKRPVQKLDFGYVGDVCKVNIQSLEMLLNNDITPVFCAITHDKNGQLLNTNADTIASELASAFANVYKTKLYYCFDKNGVLKDVNDNNSVIQQITKENFQSLIDDQSIADGMLPKLSNSFNAIKNNVLEVCIGKPAMLFDSKAIHTKIHK